MPGPKNGFISRSLDYLYVMHPKLHVGTCSWKYPSWEGLVYSSSKPDNYLKEYAQKYASVEIDQWFWSLFGVDKIVLPKEGTVEEYRAAVSSDFRFVIKAPNSISLTHPYKQYTGGALLENPHFLSPELYDQFLYALRPIQSQIGAISLQFEYLNKQKMPNADAFLTKFIQFLDNIDHTVPLCIELRNPTWLTEKYFGLLHDHGVGHTFCQGYYMPDIRQVYDSFASQIKGTQVIRLLGPDRQGMDKLTGKKWGELVAPKDDEIEGISNLIKKMVDRAGGDIYLNVNNHYEGSAPITIERMLEYF